jgi:cell division protein FtsA
LEVDEVVFSPIATAQMALDREQRERGALVIDIGGGTTDYALYLGGVITASGCIPVGGDHITNDIHLVTGLPFSKAERLKITEGDASADPVRSVGNAKLDDERGFAEVEVSRAVLNEAIGGNPAPGETAAARRLGGVDRFRHLSDGGHQPDAWFQRVGIRGFRA